MIEIIDGIINNDLFEIDYNQDYNIKLNNKNYQKFLDLNNQLSLEEFKKYLIENQNAIYTEINNIKSEYLYQSITHGINHNIRVLLYAFYLSDKLNLNTTDFQIIMDACKYHDVGRHNDLYDEKHGLRSSNLIDKIVDNYIYQNQENKQILKAIIEYHSIPDSHINQIIKKYQIEDEVRFKILSAILKDADGLDRVRLSINHRLFSDLNPKYLRLPESHRLVKCAHLLNSMFIKKVNKKIK